MKNLRSLLGSLDKPTGTCSLALLDSGAIDHMTFKSQLFHTYTPSPSNKKIVVANGSLATIAGFGDIYITPTLILKNVLHEQGLGRRIGLAKEMSGLYHAERKNRHLLNTTRALLFQGNVPKSYWGEAVLIATYMINRISSQVLDNKSPIEILKSFYPHFRTLNGLTSKVFGCTAFVHVHSQYRDKLDPRAIKCVFFGYSSTQQGYKCYNPLARKFYISANVTFRENKPFFPKSSIQGEISMIADSPCESFEPLDLPHVSTHGDEKLESSKSITLESSNFTTELVSSPIPTNVTRNFPQFPKVYSREKAISKQKQVQESNSDLGNEITARSDLGNEITVRSDPPLHTQPGETSTDSTDNLDLDLLIAVKKSTKECTNRPFYPLSHYVSLKHLSPVHKNFIVSLNTTIISNTVSEALTKRE
ncbi:Retrovirus-related Pol polyprotein from transposon TNT 1-94 [Vitis vinifera]|uniref:Retrovirus-related Pol polyprotein from transposon TNT 1-94 n=1 Tax=Vitis vinifera TaxID=29760 RepID=A0A438DPG2_VITVI|nr:Retrovirus-related Pol polyprotein from transposon TNT 1-94 [Vitis vinifera]